MSRDDARLLYFAYGSNMSGPRLAARVQGLRTIGVASLAGHRLAFHKRGRDGSGKCDIAPAAQGRVWGVVFDMPAAQRSALDRHEGLGRGYELKTVELTLAGDRLLTAFCYYATHVDPALQPYDWYRAHVLHGAREHRLPHDYVAAIGAVTAIPDPDAERARRERAIYR